jgi:hypothetical protein
MEEAIEIRCPPVGQRVRLCRWFFVKLHDLEVKRSRWLDSPQAQGRQPITSLFWLLVADRGLVLIAGKDASWDRLSTRCCFG